MVLTDRIDLKGAKDQILETKEPKKQFQVKIYLDWCKRCGICAAFCPKSVLVLDEKKFPQALHPEVCIGCRLCEIHCPDFAIEVMDNTIKSQNRDGASMVQDVENIEALCTMRESDALQCHQG